MQWAKDKKEFLRQSYGHTKAKDIAEQMGTTTQSVYLMAYKMGMRKPNPTKIILSEREELWLELNYPHMSNQVCASILGISLRTVVRHARRLGLRKTEKFMQDCQRSMARKAKESHIRNGTYPAKGWYSLNLQKGAIYQFKKKTGQDAKT